MSYTVTPLSLGAVLRRVREQQGLGLSGAARAAGMSRGYLWLVERGGVNIAEVEALVMAKEGRAAASGGTGQGGAVDWPA